VDDILSMQQSQRIQKIFSVSSGNISDLAVIKISFLPHKKGFPHQLIRYECSKNLESLLECEIEQFFNMCNSKWNQLHAELNEKKDLFPILWRMLKPTSHRKVMSLLMEFVLFEKPMLEMLNQMEVCSFFGNVSKCLALFTIEPMPEPFQFMPESCTMVMKPLDSISK
jgi:hypothetical protein